MPILRLAAAVMLIVGVSACSTDQQPDAEPAEAILAAERDSLMDLEREWSYMFGQGDVDGIAALLGEDSVLLAPGRSPAFGRDSVIATTRSLLAAEAADGVSVSWEPQAAFVSSSGDMAYDYGRATTTLTTTLADGTIVEGSYLVVWTKYLVVWTKEDGEWKAAADMFN